MQEVPQDFKDATIVRIYKIAREMVHIVKTIGKLAIVNSRRRYWPKFFNQDVRLLLKTSFQRVNVGSEQKMYTRHDIHVEKCTEQPQRLIMTFVDFRTAFDTVQRGMLWLLGEIYQGGAHSS